MMPWMPPDTITTEIVERIRTMKRMIRRLNESMTDVATDAVWLKTEVNQSQMEADAIRTDERTIPMATANPRLNNNRCVAIAEVTARRGGTILYQTRALVPSRRCPPYAARAQMARNASPASRISFFLFKHKLLNRFQFWCISSEVARKNRIETIEDQHQDEKGKQYIWVLQKSLLYWKSDYGAAQGASSTYSHA